MNLSNFLLNKLFYVNFYAIFYTYILNLWKAEAWKRTRKSTRIDIQNITKPTKDWFKN